MLQALPEESPQLQQQRALLEAMVIKDPPADFEFTAEAPSISAYDLCVSTAVQNLVN